MMPARRAPLARRRPFLCALRAGLCALLAGFATALLAAAAHAAGPAVVLDIDGPIGPATSEYVIRGLARAAEQEASVVVLRQDTPGGLDTSMRAIIRAVIASPVPVVAWVAPSGARAASAGTYILYASHIAAMAPGTNVGAATPVAIGIGGPGSPHPGDTGKGDTGKDDTGKDDTGKDDTGKGDGGKSDGGKDHIGKGGKDEPPHSASDRKAVNDAAAYLRGLAQMRGRNVDWAEKAVREAASLPAEEALKLKVIDVVAADLPSLLRAIDGRQVMLALGPQKLATKEAVAVEIAPDWKTRLLATITNPTVAALLMMIGIYALIFEFYTPGFVGPGVVGAICVLLALYAFHLLPVDTAGLALLLLGIGMMVAEMFVGTFGALAAGGLVAFVIGSVMLIDEDAPGFGVDWPVVGAVALACAALSLIVASFVLRARRRPIVAGREQMLGSDGVVLAWREGAGRIRVRGELWQARARAPLVPGAHVRVTAIDGLTLDVEPAGNRREKHDG